MAVLAPAVGDGVRALTLRAAVRKTLMYSDLFDFPLTAGELSNLLFDVGADEAEIVAAARTCPDVLEVNDHFCLAGRGHLVAERRRRHPASAHLWRKARRYARLIAAAPFVRMVAVTGSLAPGNARAGDDIDLLLVVEPGRLWLTRLLVLVVVRAVRLLGDELCPNFLLANNYLAIDGSAFPAYYARELTQMVPLYGSRTYRALRLANGWTSRLLPNSNHVRRPELPDRVPGLLGLVKDRAERVLRCRFFDSVEAAERHRKVARLRARHARERGIVEFSADRCRGHFGGYVQHMMVLFQLRASALDGER